MYHRLKRPVRYGQVSTEYPKLHASCCAAGGKALPAGSYQVARFCLEPDAFFVREEGRKEFDPSRVLTRQTYTLDMVGGGSQ